MQPITHTTPPQPCDTCRCTVTEVHDLTTDEWMWQDDTGNIGDTTHLHVVLWPDRGDTPTPTVPVHCGVPARLRPSGWWCREEAIPLPEFGSFHARAAAAGLAGKLAAATVWTHNPRNTPQQVLDAPTDPDAAQVLLWALIAAVRYHQVTTEVDNAVRHTLQALTGDTTALFAACAANPYNTAANRQPDTAPRLSAPTDADTARRAANDDTEKGVPALAVPVPGPAAKGWAVVHPKPRVPAT